MTVGCAGCVSGASCGICAVIGLVMVIEDVLVMKAVLVERVELVVGIVLIVLGCGRSSGCGSCAGYGSCASIAGCGRCSRGCGSCAGYGSCARIAGCGRCSGCGPLCRLWVLRRMSVNNHRCRLVENNKKYKSGLPASLLFSLYIILILSLKPPNHDTTKSNKIFSHLSYNTKLFTRRSPIGY